jgi:hypothetical protein
VLARTQFGVEKGAWVQAPTQDVSATETNELKMEQSPTLRSPCVVAPRPRVFLVNSRAVFPIYPPPAGFSIFDFGFWIPDA